MKTETHLRGEIENTSFDNNSQYVYLSKELEKGLLAFSYDNYRSDSDVFVEEEVRTTPPFTDFQIDSPRRDRSKFSVFYDVEELSETVESLHFDVYYQESKRSFNTFSDLFLNFGPMPIVRDSNVFTDSNLDTIGANFQVGLNLSDNNHLIAGFEVKDDDLSQTRRRELTENDIFKPTEIVEDSASQVAGELYLEDVLKLGDDFELRAGCSQCLGGFRA